MQKSSPHHSGKQNTAKQSYRTRAFLPVLKCLLSCNLQYKIQFLQLPSISTKIGRNREILLPADAAPSGGRLTTRMHDMKDRARKSACIAILGCQTQNFHGPARAIGSRASPKEENASNFSAIILRPSNALHRISPGNIFSHQAARAKGSRGQAAFIKQATQLFHTLQAPSQQYTSKSKVPC